MVVQDRQRVAPSTFGDGNMALEVHLPQLVGLGVLESLIGLVLGALGRIDKSVAPQYRRDGALGGHTIVSSVFEHLCQHVRSLSRMLSTTRRSTTTCSCWPGSAIDVVASKGHPSRSRPVHGTV